MKTNKFALSVLTMCIGYSGFIVAMDDVSNGKSYKDHRYESDETKNHKDASYDDSVHKQRLALNLVGLGYMYEMAVPDIDGDGQPDPAFCFDVDLKNAANGELIGTATDCLSNIEPGENGGVKLVGTTFFNLPNGQIVTRGLTTVQPVNQPTVTPDGEEITHITGASSDENGVIQTSGDYAWYHGTARLSGMVNLSQFDAGVGDPLYFDCLFLIDLEKHKFKHKYWERWYGKHDRKHHHQHHEKYDHANMNDSSDEHESYSVDEHEGYR
ncbi:hypothetical protein VV869_03315 [Photobacterium sp. MCCC 1A19761]|uniref:hypothetical protein n=1 Tax=Photobacterium sp. MCCC 1A19761 TaxID=3115000 RepID=UPI00307D792A